MEILDEFILSSKAPVYIAVKLSHAFSTSSEREKDKEKDLLKCAEYCESVAVDLLQISR